VRFINVTAVSAWMSVHAGQERAQEPRIESSARIELTGTMDEPVRDTRDVEIVLYPRTNQHRVLDRRPGLGWSMESARSCGLRFSFRIAVSTACGHWLSQACSSTRSWS
jgi:hypothetical protein